VSGAHQFIGFRHDNGAGIKDYVSFLPTLPDPGKGEELVIDEIDELRFYVSVRLDMPLIESISRDQASPAPES
jgi:hypothetical protein